MTLSVWSVQSTSSAGGPTKRWKRRRASAPTDVQVARRCHQVALGLGHLGPVHADHPLGEERAKGSRSAVGSQPDVGEGLGVEAGVEQVEDGVLDPADVLVDRHPVAGDVRVEGRVRCPGSVKRRKYHDESTKVSMVSVSRVAGPPQIGQVVCRNPGWWPEATGRWAGTPRRRGPAPAARLPAPGRCRGRGSTRPGWGSPRTAGGRSASRAAGS